MPCDFTGQFVLVEGNSIGLFPGLEHTTYTKPDAGPWTAESVAAAVKTLGIKEPTDVY